MDIYCTRHLYFNDMFGHPVTFYKIKGVAYFNVDEISDFLKRDITKSFPEIKSRLSKVENPEYSKITFILKTDLVEILKCMNTELAEDLLDLIYGKRSILSI